MDINGNLSPFANPPMDVIQLEGERHVPLVKRHNAAMHLGHMAAYREALRYAYGRRMLDVGCGSGYGAFFLACYSGNEVEALDAYQPALAYARHVYAHPHLHFQQADALALPYPDESFDFVFSSQVIEYIAPTRQFLAEIARVLRPNGFCLVTTPNRLLFSPHDSEMNIHHINEKALNEYQAMAAQIFPSVVMRGIPQNCLEQVGDNPLPVLKPNVRINPDDYQVSDNDLEKCENLLMYGHRQPDGKFVSLLPGGLKRASDITAPIYYDPQVRQLVAMGLNHDRQQPCPCDTVNAEGELFSFTSPMDGLYRVELQLCEPAQVPFSIYCSGKRGRQLLNQDFPAGVQDIELLLPLQKHSADNDFFLLIAPFKDKVMEKPISVPVTEQKKGRLQVTTFHQVLPSIKA